MESRKRNTLSAEDYTWRKRQHEYGLNYPIGTHYPNLSILDYFSGEPFRKHKMDYCNTCIKIVAEG